MKFDEKLMPKWEALGEPKVIEDAERHRRTPRPTAISGKAMRAWVAGFDWGRFNASRRQILPMLAFEKPKITEQAIVTWTGFQEQSRKSSIKFFQRFGNQKRAKGSRNGTKERQKGAKMEPKGSQREPKVSQSGA